MSKVFERRFETKRVKARLETIINDSINAPKMPPTKPLPETKNPEIKVIIAGNLPLQIVKLLVRIATSCSRLESIILAPEMPTQLQP